MANYHLQNVIAGDVSAEEHTVGDNGDNHNQRQARETHVRDRNNDIINDIVMVPNGIADSRRLTSTNTSTTTEILSPFVTTSTLEYMLDLALQIVLAGGDDLC
jgi:hypothetical protein